MGHSGENMGVVVGRIGGEKGRKDGKGGFVVISVKMGLGIFELGFDRRGHVGRADSGGLIRGEGRRGCAVLGMARPFVCGVLLSQSVRR